MLLFLFFVSIFVLMSFAIVTSEFRLHVYNFEYSNYKNPSNENKIKMELYLFGIIKILSIRLKKERVSNSIATNIIKEKILNIKENNIEIKLYGKDNINTITVKLIKELTRKIEVKLIKFNAIIGTEDVALTAILIGLIYTIIPNILRMNIKKINSKRYYLNISPIYNKGNKIYAKFECIIAIKIVHIINMLKNVKYGKENTRQYERTSNRRFNANSHGKHKEYDRC